MTKNIAHRKEKLIQEIIAINSEVEINEIEKSIQLAKMRSANQNIFKPMQKIIGYVGLMDYILDTNIILNYVRKSALAIYVDEQYAPLSIRHRPIISVVSVGEIKSIGIRNQWGVRKFELLNELLNEFVIADINVESIVDCYAEIDAFSQGKLPQKPSDFSSRNMSKNDLWIAATSSILEAQLLTTDMDFQHLDKTFIDLRLVQIPEN